MKYLIFLIIFLFTACGGEGNIVHTEGTPITWQLIVAILAGLYEVIARLVPTVKNYSIIAKIIEVLLWISERFNRKKK